MLTLEERLNYKRVHMWLFDNHKDKKTSTCSFCSLSFKRTEWALLKGKVYEKKLENFIELCVSCHRKYDVTEEARKNMSLAHTGQKRPWKFKKIFAVHPDGTKTFFKSVTEASILTKTSHTTLSTCLTKGKRNKGIYWKYDNALT